MTARKASQPLVPDEALPAWEALTRALQGVDTPCASDPDQWFDTDPAPAIEACGPCPMRVACLNFAVAAGERHGVWGGQAFPLVKAVAS